jgi:hypothetical protein
MRLIRWTSALFFALKVHKIKLDSVRLFLWPQEIDPAKPRQERIRIVRSQMLIANAFAPSHRRLNSVVKRRAALALGFDKKAV